MPTPGSPAPVKTEPKTAIGNFYRSHRTEVLSGAGLVVAGYAYYRKKHPSSSSSSSSTDSSSAIDSATGYPAGSAEDIAALQAQAAASSGAAVVPSSQGDGSSTGYGDGGGGTGYSGSGGYGSDIDSELQSIETTLQANGTLDQAPPPSAPGPQTQTPSQSPAVVGVAGGKTGATVSNAQNLANLDATLARDEKGTSAGDVKSTATLKKQIAAVKARS